MLGAGITEEFTVAWCIAVSDSEFENQILNDKTVTKPFIV